MTLAPTCAMAVEKLLLLAFLTAQGSCGKNSLTFVIDDTYSMHDEIVQVKDAAKEIVNIVLNEKSSQIEDILLVTFNDPETVFRKRTRDGEELKQALSSIKVHGGGDCPEVALTGIKRALEESQPGSYLFVFTDASAKDYRMFEEIKTLSQERQSQIVIVVTNPGRCDKVPEMADEVYHQIAAASNGQVFRVDKDEVGEVLEYVKEMIKGESNVITSVVVPANEWSHIQFKIDDQTEYAIVSASGTNVELYILDQNMRLMTNAPHITWTDNVKAVKLTLAPGTYTARVRGNTEVNIMVFGRTDFTFEHGFSTKVESSLRNTETQPTTDIKTHLMVSVKDPKHSANVQSVELLDMKEAVIASYPLTRVTNNVYATEKFLSPSQTFKIAVVATWKRTGKTVRRIAKTPVTPIKPVYVAPVLSKTEKHIKVKEGAAADVHCRILRGKPRPQITWFMKREHESGFKKLDGELDEVIQVTNAQTNDYYKCQATNRKGQDEHTVQLDVQVPPGFENTANVITATVGQRVTIECMLRKGNPRPNAIEWQLKRVNSNNYQRLSNSREKLSYHMVQSEHSGTYRCIARNNEGTAVKETKLVILEKPSIVNPEPYKSAMENTTIILQCGVIRGIPKPTINWFYKNPASNEYHTLSKHEENLKLENIKLETAGNYRCEARNSVGQSATIVQLVVNAPPRIVSDTSNYVGVEGDVAMRLPCTAVGYPTPRISWAVNNHIVSSDKSKELYVDGNALVLKNPKKEHSTTERRSYVCQASNDFGKADQIYDVQISEYPEFIKPDETTISTQNQPYVLKCPLPYTDPNSVRWYKNAIYDNVTGPSLRFEDPEFSDSNNYTCRVSDINHAASYTIEVIFGYPPTKSLTSFNVEWEGESKDIDCRCSQYPEGKYEWFYNGEKIKDAQSHKLALGLGWGQYSCHVTNPLGSLIINFKVTTVNKDCVIPKSLFETANMPLVLDTSSSWPAIPTIGQYYVVPHSEKLELTCPENSLVAKKKSTSNSFQIFSNLRSIYATCDNEESFLVNGIPKKISELACAENVAPSVKTTGNPCLGNNTQLIKIGFYVNGFIEVYQSCVDMVINVPLYTKMTTIPLEWEDFESGIKRGKESCVDECCYETIQLVNPIDVGLGSAKKATYINNLNSVNYCKPKNYTNWQDIETINRRNRQFTVWSGAVNYSNVNAVWTPKYLWKVIKEVESSQIVAIIHENVQKPGPKICAGKCGHSSVWFEPEGDRTYCCNLDEFKKALGITIDFDES